MNGRRRWAGASSFARLAPGSRWSRLQGRSPARHAPSLQIIRTGGRPGIRLTLRRSKTSTASTAIRPSPGKGALVLIKRTEHHVRRESLAAALQHQSDPGLDRRSFLRRSGLIAGSLASLGALPLTSLRPAEAGPPP